VIYHMANPENIFGVQLRKIRELRGYSQTDFASLIGMGQPNYSKYEKGEVLPGFNFINELACTFNISEEYFFRNANPAEYLLLDELRQHSHGYPHLKESDREHFLRTMEALQIGLASVQNKEQRDTFKQIRVSRKQRGNSDGFQ